MYGVTELESLHLPLGGDVPLMYGMLEKERDEELMRYMRTRCELKPEACFSATKAKYNYNERSVSSRLQISRSLSDLIDASLNLVSPKTYSNTSLYTRK